jgi:tungstate transport system substrate-binding protein
MTSFTACSGGGDGDPPGTATPVDPTTEAVAALTQSAISTEEAPPPLVNTRAPGPAEQPTLASGTLALAVSDGVGDGLLDVLIPLFEAETGYSVQPLTTNSVAAIEQGRRGEADVVLVDAPLAEQEMLDSGDGIERALVMSSDYLLVGPEADPAGVRDQERADDALRAIAAAGARFVGSGGDQDVVALEAGLWAKVSVVPTGQGWYELAPEALERANAGGAYALASRSAVLTARQGAFSLEILLEGDPALVAAYHVVVVNPETHPGVNVEAARAFAAFITRADVQQIIGEYGIAEYGSAVFAAQAGQAEPRR